MGRSPRQSFLWTSRRSGWALSAALLLLATTAAQGQEQDDNPRLRSEFFLQQRAYPFQTIRPGALQAARAEAQSRWSAAAFGLNADMAGVGWEAIGPERIPGGLTSTGRLTTIAVHPFDSETIYIGGAQGGVWKTSNGGVNWTPLTDKECSLAMGSIAIDPVNPEIVYAGTGELHFSGDSYYGCGVLRSTDGGASWTQLGGEVFRGASRGAMISRVTVVPSTAGSTVATRVLAASSVGLFRSIDSGGSWTRILEGIITDLAIDSGNENILYAGVHRTGVFKSTDGGNSWLRLLGGLPTASVGRIALAVAPSQPETLYAAIHDQSNGGLLGIFRSEDRGVSWVNPGSAGADCRTQCWYDLTVIVDPFNPDRVFFGGVDVWRSFDGGATYLNVRGGIHVDQHTFTFDPQNPSVLYVGNDGGIYRTTNNGSTWTTLNTDLALTQFYGGVSPHPEDPDRALGGTQDNGTLEFLGSPDWDKVLGGDGGFTAIDGLRPERRYAETQWTTNALSKGPRRSDDGGPFFQVVRGIDLDDRALFIPPLVMHPRDTDVLYFGTQRLYRTQNGAGDWDAISGILSPEESPISAIAPSVLDRDVVYVGTTDGRAFLTVDGGSTWTSIDLGLPNRWVTDIAVHPDDWQVAYLTVSGFGTGHVFRTENAGATWEDVSTALPDLPVNSILLEPGRPNTVYLGTDLGVYRSIDGGTTWNPFNDGMPMVAVFDIAAMPNTGVIVAATHGRGMFRHVIDIPLSFEVGDEADRSLEVPEGTVVAKEDSARVNVFGVGASQVAWTAQHDGEPWLVLGSIGGTGQGVLRWTKDPGGVEPGVYVDTIRISATGFGEWTIVEQLTVVSTPLTVRSDPEGRSVRVPAGNRQNVFDSVFVEIVGQGAPNAAWGASNAGAPWLTMTVSSGEGRGYLKWRRDPTGLLPGTYVDTIRVEVEGAVGSPVTVVDSLTVEGISFERVVAQLLLGAGLSALEQALIDEHGNTDRLFNLGDVVAWLAFCETVAEDRCDLGDGVGIRRFLESVSRSLPPEGRR